MKLHFATLYHGTMITMFDEDSRQADYGERVIEYAETVADFDRLWTNGETVAVRFEGEVWVKLKVSEDCFDVMTITSANEFLGSQEEE